MKSLELLEIPLNQLRPAAWNPRKSMDAGKLDELVASIRSKGVLEPAIVRPIDRANAAVVYEVVAGHRRLAAAERAGLETLPCIVRDLSDSGALEIAVIENSQRADVHPIEEAEAIERLMLLDSAYTVEAVAAKLGVHVTTVNRKLRLLKLIDAAREAYAANAITSAHAERLAKLPADVQSKALVECFSDLLIGEDLEDELAEARADIYREHPDVSDIETEVGLLIHRRDWARLAQAIASINTLDRWIRERTKVDVAGDTENKQLVLEQLTDDDVTALSAAADEPGEIVGALEQLSATHNYNFDRAAAKAMGVLHASQWHEIANDKDACDQAKKGVIVHGGDLRVVSFCRKSKKCTKHWPVAEKPTRAAAGDSTGPSEKPYWEIERERRDAEAKAWGELREALRPLVVAHVKNAKFNAALVRIALDEHKVSVIRREYGVELTDKTAAQVMALAGLQDWDRANFIASAKEIGFSLTKAEQQIKAAAKAKEKAAAKKAAPAAKRAKAAKAKGTGQRAKAPTKKGGRK